MGLIEELPEIADYRRRQHHRQEDDRRPEAMSAEFAIDQIGESETDERLQRYRPEDEMSRHLHRVPDFGIAEDVRVVCRADGDDRSVWTVGLVVREREIDRPEERKDVDGEQQDNRRRDKEQRIQAYARLR